jgi:spore germination protein YaaH
MKAANGDGNVTNEEVLAAANEVIAEATARRAKERARLDEELRQLELAEAIAETDREVEKLARQRSEEKISTAKTVSAGSGSADRPDQEEPERDIPSGKDAEFQDREDRPDNRVPGEIPVKKGQSEASPPHKEKESPRSGTGAEDKGSRSSKAGAEDKDSRGSEADTEGKESRHPKAGPAGAEGEGGVKKKKRRRRKSGRRFLFPLLLLCMFVCTAGAVILIHRYTPTNARMSWQDYFGDLAADEAAIVLQDELIDRRALVSDGELYLPYPIVEESLNSRFYWDDASTKMLFTTAEQTFEIPINSTSYSVIDGALTSDPISQANYEHVIVLRDDSGKRAASGEDQTSSEKEKLYVNAEYLARYTNVAYTWEKETQHVLIRCRWGDMLTAQARKETAVRYMGGIKSPILTDLEKGEEVYVLEAGEKWLRVLTDDGFIGWVQLSRMTGPQTKTVENSGFTEPVYPDLTSDERITIVWHYMDSESGNSSYENRTADMTGVDVISPTWFSLTDNEGNIRSIGKKSYVKKAHKDNLQVWGLVSDFSSDMDTSLVLASTAARRNCIGNLVSEAERLGLDGINLDFEYMEAPDGAAYSQFVREMSIACRKSGLVFSVDLACPYEWNSYIDRKEVGTVADYLINMGYDEHYVGSEAGSVASLAFEERAVRELIKMGIPERKIISGVPFYTRIWYTSWNDDGTMNINSEELSMGVVQTTLNTWGVTPVWDAETAQNYADWTLDNGVRCQIWIEDGESMARKILLIPKYNLGGTAAWVLGAQSDSIWQVISDNLNLSNEEAAARESEYAAEYADISEAVEDSTEA